MLTEIKLIGRIPSKKNSKIMSCMGKGRPRLFPSKNYTVWHKEATKQLKEQKIQPLNYNALSISIEFYSPDRRKYDLTNKAESIMDLLVDCGIIIDDNFDIINKVTLIYGGVEKGGIAYIRIIHDEKNKIETI